MFSDDSTYSHGCISVPNKESWKAIYELISRANKKDCKKNNKIPISVYYWGIYPIGNQANIMGELYKNSLKETYIKREVNIV